MNDNASAAEPLTRSDIEAKIVALAWRDDEFRRRFIADPKGQFEERIGQKLPSSLAISVHEENENDLHFVIPVKPRPNTGELSDDDLERVTGGTGVIPLIIMGATVSFEGAPW